jgi:hypothetical protein
MVFGGISKHSREPIRPVSRRGAMPSRSIPRPLVARSVSLVVGALLAVACSGPAPSPAVTGGPPTTSPSGDPSQPEPSAPIAGEIEHRTGVTDVVLRFSYGGGFVPIEYMASQAPGFTLFGNGVVVFQRAAAAAPPPDANGVVKEIPWRTAKLDEGQIRDLLAFALGQGGLGIARASYPSTGVADAGDTIFTIHAGGVDKTVTIDALGMVDQPEPDSAARAAFNRLAERLRDFDQGGSISSDVYQADRYRGILSERAAAGNGAIAWPWPAVKPAEFVPGANGSGEPIAPHRAMSLEEVAALKLTGIEGGVQGLALLGPDGKAYTLALRPLLVDEAS